MKIRFVQIVSTGERKLEPPQIGNFRGFLAFDPVQDGFVVLYPAPTREGRQAFNEFVDAYVESHSKTMPPAQSGQDPGQR